MRYPLCSLRRFSSFFTTALTSLVLLIPFFFLVTACDSGGTSENTSSGGNQPGDGDSSTSIEVTANETAESIVTSLGETTGGFSNEIVDASIFFESDDPSSSKSTSPISKSLDRSWRCDYSSQNENWDCKMASVGSGGPVNQSTLEREYTLQFFEISPSGATPVRKPTSADSMTLSVDDGSGSFNTDRLDVNYQMFFAEWALADAPNGEYNITLLGGSAGRSLSSTFTGREVSRFRDAETFITDATDLVYRLGTSTTDGRFVSGSIEGLHDVTIRTVDETGTTDRTRDIEVDFKATFSESGASISFTGDSNFSGNSFSFDPSTGTLSQGSP